MNKDDLIYISLLLISIPFGYIIKKCNLDPRQKSTLSSLFGFILVFIVCPNDIYHSLVLSFVNSLMIQVINSKYLPIFSFFWCFGYLLFFRMVDYFGLQKPVPYANAVQLILTLKCVGFAFEVHDSSKRKKQLTELNKAEDKKEEIEKIKLEIEYLSIESKPSILDSMLYSYCYIGILTGPYFKYRTYLDWLNTKYSLNIDTISFIKKRAFTAPFIITGFLILSRFISFQDAAKDEFYESSLAYRLLYMALIFTLFRFRFYIAWIFAEVSCISAEFGVYPVTSKPKSGAGPTDLKELKKFDKKSANSEDYNFECIKNIDEYKTETALTVKDVLHYWNMTVQYWMASYVYKRVPFKKFGQPITMAVSAYWHGLHPGYYLSMLTTSPCILAENLMEKGFKKKYLNEKYYRYYNFCTWFFRSREFDYMSLGFILLSYNATIRFWQSVYFIGHFTCLFFIIVGYILTLLSKKKREKTQ